ncbi:MAG: WXG100 family type VII secretion target [Mycobacteriaceae bacterium]
MSDQFFRASPERILGVSAQLSAASQELQQQLATLDSQVSGFLEQGWTGASGGVYAHIWQLWHHGCAEIQAGLTDAAQVLAQTGHGFAATEQHNTESLTAHSIADTPVLTW